jgi:hypothetical protein
VRLLWLLVFIVTVILALISCSEENSKIVSSEITWSENIAPIIYKNCTPCHRPGEAGGFSLLTYNDALKKANQIKFVTRTRYMPPWPADPEYSHFADEKVLNQEQIDLIVRWVDEGVKRGDSLAEPAPPDFYKGSFFGKPDLIVRPQQAVKIKGNGTDAFLVIKYPFKLERDTVVDFVEFVPHQRKLVHHVNGHLVSYDSQRKFDYYNGSSIHEDTRTKMMEVYRQMHIPYTDAAKPEFPTLTPNTVYYLPGYIPPAYPKEIGGFRIKKNGLFLLNNIHYGPSNADVTDSSYINVFFRKTPIVRPVQEMQLGTFGVSVIEPEFIIPPNEIKTFHTSYTLQKSISMISVNPHMHLIGKTFHAFATGPSGDTLPIIKIKKWDFRWQYYYTFRKPLKLPIGYTIHAIGTFDNTSNNVNNPFHPPRSITQGNGIESMKTTEEMFQLIFTYVAYKEGDENINLERK